MACRIPRTATRRGAICYAKLLARVDARAMDGFGFEGKFLRPGAEIDEAELGAGKGRNAVLLESTDIEDGRDPANRRRWERLYILWRWESKSSEWIEIARARHNGGDWAHMLREPARIALGRESWSVVPKVSETTERIREVLDRELAGLDPRHQSQVLSELHDQLAARMVRVGAA